MTIRTFDHRLATVSGTSVQSSASQLPVAMGSVTMRHIKSVFRVFNTTLLAVGLASSLLLGTSALASAQTATPAPSPAPSSAPAASSAQPSTPTGQKNGTLRSQHGAWSILCDKPAGAKTEQCALIQNVIAADRPELGLSVVVLKTADNKARILRVLAPLGVLLPNGLGLNVDGKDIGRAYFVRCFEDGCYAEVILDDALIDTFRKGKAATFIVFQTPEEGVGIPVELQGFSDGFNKLP